jgi:signal recognition particle receptor subunit beta
MALINHRAREVHLKVVYCGPGLGGKTTNLRQLHDRLPPERRGRLLSIATDHERTLFFDFLPLDLGAVNGFVTRFHLYTVPGQVYYKLSRKAVLQGVDGIVFVADSHPAREHANQESLADMHQHLAAQGLTPAQLAQMPRVFQWNKRDLAVAIPVERLRAALNPQGWPEFEAVASQGRGVSEALRAACKAVLARLAMPATAPAPAAVPVQRPGAAFVPPAPRPAPAPAPGPAPATAGAPRPVAPPTVPVPRPTPTPQSAA